VTYLNVITAQATELADKESAVSILGTRMADTVLLIEALGGGWDATVLSATSNGGRGTASLHRPVERSE